MDVYSFGTVVIRVSQIAMAHYECCLPHERDGRVDRNGALLELRMTPCVVVTLVNGKEMWMQLASPEQAMSVLDDIKKRMERLTEADHAFIKNKLHED